MLQSLLGLINDLFEPSDLNHNVDIDMRFKSTMRFSPPEFTPIYGSYGLCGTIHDLVNVIKASARTKTYDADLERTFVTNASHWRSSRSEHELVMVTYKAGNPGEHTTRHLGLERFRLQTNRKGSGLPSSLQVISQPSQLGITTNATQCEPL